MTVKAVNITETPKRNNAHTMLLGTTGAVVGGLSRYVVPKKGELSSFGDILKADTFTNSKMAARAKDRSILKYAGIGAVVMAGAGLVAKLIKNSKIEKNNPEQVEYTKLGMLIDSSDYACEIVWWGDADSEIK